MSRIGKFVIITALAAGAFAGSAYAVGAIGGGGSGSPAATYAALARKGRTINPQRVLQRRQALFTALGQQLGKSESQVASAARATLVDRLNQAVSRGRMSADQEKAILAGYDAGLPRYGLRSLFGHHRRGMRLGTRRPQPGAQGANGAPQIGGMLKRRGAREARMRAAIDDFASKLGVSPKQLALALGGVLMEQRLNLGPVK